MNPVVKHKLKRKLAAIQKPDVGTSPDPESSPGLEGYVRGPYDSELGGIPVSPTGTLEAREKALATKEKKKRK